ncbi:hypothetical protein GCM10028820_31520 [Tessaracoccus terricola]
MTNILKGVGALLLLTSLLAGLPWVLIQLALRPGFLPSWQRLQAALTSPDDGRVLLVIVWVIGWLTWVALAVLVAVELVAALRRVRAPRIPALAVLQGLVHSLLATAAVLFITAPLVAAPPVAAETTQPVDNSNTQTATAIQESAGDTNPTTLIVAPGGSLWAYAEEHLGDGNQWPRIYSHNKGQRQADGGALTDPNTLHPGWILKIPPSQPNADLADQSGKIRVTVSPGDTLWDLAQDHLGDANRWPEIYDHNQGVVQADGSQLGDPDHIEPGWILTIPATGSPSTDTSHGSDTDISTTVTAQPRANENPQQEASPEPKALDQPNQPAGQPTSPATATPAPPPSQEPDRLAEPDGLEDEAHRAPSWQVAGLLGAGTLLGAGIFTALQLRRKDQFRQRQPGLTIATPDPVVAPIEMTTTIAAGLSRHRLERVDEVLRRITAVSEFVPVVTAVRVGQDGTITLQAREQLLEPWEPVAGGWSLPSDVDLEVVGATYPDQPAPYPLLVTVGADDDGNSWLLNLEALGILEVGGDDIMRQDFIRYIAAELAVNPWATTVQVACLGIASETIPMAPERFTTQVEHVTQLAAANIDRAHRANTDAATGRAHQLEDEAWPATVAITNNTSHTQELGQLIEGDPHASGSVIVACSDDSEGLHIASSGRITGLGLDLIAVGLTTDEAAGCAALLAAAADLQPGAPVPAADHLTDQAGNLLPEVTVARDNDSDDYTEPLLPEPDEDYIAVAPVTATDLQLLAPRTHTQVAQEILNRDPHLDRDVEAWFSPNCPLPRLTWLGPVKARCHGTPPTKSRAYYTEVLSYLAAHPDGVTNDQIVDAFNITPQRARTVISNLRQWVGTNPTTGEPHIPDAKNSPQAIERGVGLYLVQNLLIDADLFRRLRTRAQARGKAGIVDLETALTLVTGTPFEHLRPAGWSWLTAGDRIDHHMTCAIADASHTLVTHHLEKNDQNAARLAAEVALAACPESETAILDLDAIMHQDGDTQGASQRLRETINRSAVDAPIDVSSRTRQLLQLRRYIDTG